MYYSNMPRDIVLSFRWCHVERVTYCVHQTRTSLAYLADEGSCTPQEQQYTGIQQWYTVICMLSVQTSHAVSGVILGLKRLIFQSNNSHWKSNPHVVVKPTAGSFTIFRKQRTETFKIGPLFVALHRENR